VVRYLMFYQIEHTPLVHEYGHLVEAALLTLPKRMLNIVYSAMDEILWPPSWRQSPAIRARATALGCSIDGLLVSNWPTIHAANHGPHRSQLIDLLAVPRITPLLGEYAATSAQELFAEMFALSIDATSPQLINTLSPFRSALIAVGLTTK
jgi:hypothetical protein